MARCNRDRRRNAASAAAALLFALVVVLPTAVAAAEGSDGTTTTTTTKKTIRQLLPDVSSTGPCKDEARALCAHVFEGDDEATATAATATPTTPPEAGGNRRMRRSLLLDENDEKDAAALKKVAELLRVPYPITDRDALSKASPLALCLRKALHDEQFSTSASPAAAAATTRLSDACASDVRAFFAGRAADPARDPALIEACARESAELCAPSLSVKGPFPGAAPDGPVPLLTCLTHKKLADGFSPRCEALVALRQQESAEDVALDPALLGACADDLKSLCPSAMAPGAWRHDASAARMCLERVAVSTAGAPAADEGSDEQPRRRLSKSCAAALFSRMARDSEDIRFHYRLSSACARDAKRSCEGVKPGNSRLIDCLEDARHDPDFSPGCAAALADFMLLRASDARLDWPLRKSCEKDADRFAFSSTPEAAAAALGNTPASSILRDVRFVRASPGEGFNITGALRRHLDQLEYDSCRATVRRRAVQAYEDSTLDAELMVACARNITDNCADPTKALGCLKDLLRQRASLAPACRGVLAARLREASSDIRFIPEVARACRAERRRFCGGLDGASSTDEQRAHDSGGRFGGSLSGDGAAGDVLDCLADFAQEGVASAPSSGALLGGGGDADADAGGAGAGGSTSFFGDACRAALNDHLALAVEDVRQLHGLNRDCAQDRARLCPGVLPGKGRVVGCLQNNRARVREPQCRRQLLRLMGLSVGDWRLDYALREACESDVRKQCSHVRPGGGRVHSCLRQHENALAPKCRREVRRVEAAEHADVRLNRELAGACSSAAALFCGSVAPGQANVISCLREAAAAAEVAAGARAGGLARWWDGVLTGAGVRWDSAPSLAMAGGSSAGEGGAEGDGAKAGNATEAAAASAAAPTATAFPAACRRALRKQLHRAATRLSFNPRLHATCREDLTKHCPATAEALFSSPEGAGADASAADASADAADAAANPEEAEAEAEGETDAAESESENLTPEQESAILSRDDHDRAAMDCLSRTEAELSPDCGSALGESTRLLLHDYLPGASLTSPCDPDAARLCGATADTAPLMEPGSVRACLVRHLHDLQRECWSLVSRVEPSAAQARAERVEALLFDPSEEEEDEALVAGGKKKNKNDAAASALVGQIARHVDSRGADGLDAALQKALRSAGAGGEEGGGALYAALLQALSSTDEARRAQREAAAIGARGRAARAEAGPPGWLLWGAVGAAALTAVAGGLALVRYATRMRAMLRGGQIVYKDGRA
jgi:Golgi apparatus protein 1